MSEEMDRWQDQQTGGDGPEPRQRVMRCLNCLSEDIVWKQGEYRSGVVAPDGYEERLYAQGWDCHSCGAFEDHAVDEEEYAADCSADSLSADRAHDQRATGPSPEEERRARGLDEEQGIYRGFS